MFPMKTGFAFTFGSEMVCNRIFLTRKETKLDVLIKVDLHLKTKCQVFQYFLTCEGDLFTLNNAIPASEKTCIRDSSLQYVLSSVIKYMGGPQ